MNSNDIITPEISYDIEAEKPVEVKEIEGEQVKEEQDIATVVEHKGWNRLINEIDSDIKQYSDITQVSAIKDIEQLAVTARSNAVIADYLKAFKRRVEDAARE